MKKLFFLFSAIMILLSTNALAGPNEDPQFRTVTRIMTFASSPCDSAFEAAHNAKETANSFMAGNSLEQVINHSLDVSRDNRGKYTAIVSIMYIYKEAVPKQKKDPISP